MTENEIPAETLWNAEKVARSVSALVGGSAGIIARAIREHGLAALRPGDEIGHGLVVMPKEITKTMALAGDMAVPEVASHGCDTRMELAFSRVRPVYRALLAAAKEG